MLLPPVNQNHYIYSLNINNVPEEQKNRYREELLVEKEKLENEYKELKKTKVMTTMRTERATIKLFIIFFPLIRLRFCPRRLPKTKISHQSGEVRFSF